MLAGLAGAGGELVVHWCDSVDWPSDGPFYTVHRCSSVESDRFVAVDWLKQFLMVLQLMKVLLLLLLLLLKVVMSELVLLPSSASLSLSLYLFHCVSGATRQSTAMMMKPAHAKHRGGRETVRHWSK